MTFDRCPYCGGAAGERLEASERIFGLDGCFTYRGCEDCGALWLDSPPADLERFYPADYYTQRPIPRRARRPIVAPVARALTRWCLRDGRLPRLLSGRRFGRFDWLRRTGTGLDDPILDVGCGNGRLLARLADRGFTALAGIDPRAPDPSPGDPWPRIERATPIDHEGAYRLVMAHHSFEHMEDPAAAFAALARLVVPGGHLLLRVPRADGWARSHYGSEWAQLDAPRHLHLPTRRSIECLAAQLGLELVDVVDDSGPFQVWGSEVCRRGVPLSRAGRGGRNVLTLADRLRARFRARQLRARAQGDQACFYLRKPMR